MKYVLRSSLACASAAMLMGLSCSSAQRPALAQRPASAQAGADTVGARAAIARLEADARALAKTDGCAGSSQCRTAPVGVRPCGQPRTYLAYCAASTDSAALFRKLDELKAAEASFNKAAGLFGSCEFPQPPTAALHGASCALTSP